MPRLLRLCFAGIYLCAGCSPNTETKKMTVTLGAGVDECSSRGLTYASDDGLINDHFAISERTTVSIVYGGKELLRTISFATFLEAKRGAIRSVTVSPLEEVVTYRDAVATVHQLGGKLGLGSDEAFSLQLNRLSTHTPTRSPFEAQTLRHGLNADIEAFFEIKPHASGGGWFVNLSLLDLSQFEIE